MKADSGLGVIEWPDCDDETPAIINLRESGEILKYKNEDIIFRTSGPLDRIFLIQSGTVALFAEIETKKTSISEIVFEGDLFGFSSTGQHDSSAMALSNLTLTAYPISRVIEAQKSSIEFSSLLLQRQLNRLKKNQRQIHRVSHLTALESVADYLHELAISQSGNLSEGQVVPLPLNRFKTADYLGLTFETVSRSFGQLKKMGLIDFSNARSIIIKQPFPPGIARA